MMDVIRISILSTWLDTVVLDQPLSDKSVIRIVTAIVKL